MFISCKCFMMVITHVIAYQWLGDNDHLDCVVAISKSRKPEHVSTGVLLFNGVVLTSANPLDEYWTYTQKGDIWVYRVFKTYYEHKHNNVEKMVTQSRRRRVWVGYDRTHSPIHDIAIMNLNVRYSPFTNRTTYNFRKYTTVSIASDKSAFSPEVGWYFAGFGFIDENDLNESNYLEVEYLDSGTQTDCDEWIPREWGHFLCFHDFNNLAGVPSGAPLFQATNFIPKYTPVYGLGSFSLTKNEETILVFTDLRRYTRRLFGGGQLLYDGYFPKDYFHVPVFDYENGPYG